MKKIQLLAILMACLIGQTKAQHKYVSLMQDGNEWSVMHGDNVVFHGSGTVDFKDLPPFINYVIGLLDTIVPDSQSAPKAVSRKAAIQTVEPILKTSWHQNEPYNNLMPTMDGVHAPAGCATISTAQIVNHYGYMRPWSVSYDQVYFGNGTLFHDSILSWYDSTQVNCKEPVYHIKFSTDGWQESLSPEKLCEAISFGQHAFYSQDATSTNSQSQFTAIQKYFGYKSDFYTADILSISDSLRKQLDIQRPVIVNGSDASYTNAHSFVVDGYNSEGEFHLNLGWGESWNCWSLPSAWMFNNGMNLITMYPDYDDESLFVKEDEAGTVIFHNTTTGEFFKQKMTDIPVSDGYTGLPLSYGFGAFNICLTAGEYDYYLEYASGQQLSVPMPAIQPKESYSSYNHYSNAFVKGTSSISIPYACRLTFYTVFNTYGMQVILEDFQRGTYSVGDLDFCLTSQDSTVNMTVPSTFSQNSYGGTYLSETIDNIQAGNYKISANVQNAEIGNFRVGVGASAYPCTGNNYMPVNSYCTWIPEYMNWLWTASITKWTEASMPHVEPLMIQLPDNKENGGYEVVLYYETGNTNAIGLYAKWISSTGLQRNDAGMSQQEFKIIENDRIVIIRDGARYDVFGRNIQ